MTEALKAHRSVLRAFSVLKKACFHAQMIKKKFFRFLSLQVPQQVWGPEGFQRAIGKPFGRARRREPLCVCKNVLHHLQKCKILCQRYEALKAHQKRLEGFSVSGDKHGLGAGAHPWHTIASVRLQQRIAPPAPLSIRYSRPRKAIVQHGRRKRILHTLQAYAFHLGGVGQQGELPSGHARQGIASRQ